jgi:hypothetical protein
MKRLTGLSMNQPPGDYLMTRISPPIPAGKPLADGTKTVMIDDRRVIYFWDRSMKLWTCYPVDGNEFQLGQAEYAVNVHDLHSALMSASRNFEF